MTASPARVRNGRIACWSTDSRPLQLRADRRCARADGLVPRADDAREALGLSRELFRPAVVRFVERIVVAHRRGRGPQQKPQVAPVDRQMLELQDRTRLQKVVQIVGLEPDRRQRHAGLDAPLDLQELDLQIGSRGQVGLILFQSPQLGDFACLRASRRRRRGSGRSLRFTHARILAELDEAPGVAGRAKLSVCVTFVLTPELNARREEAQKAVTCKTRCATSQAHDRQANDRTDAFNPGAPEGRTIEPAAEPAGPAAEPVKLESPAPKRRARAAARGEKGGGHFDSPQRRTSPPAPPKPCRC